jgi:NADH dehydrogenase [ubiquinone] 1 alpha subcomplex assembly factor 5
MRGPLSLCQRTSQLLLRGRRRTTKETDTLIPSISYCTNIDNKTIDGPQSPRVKIFDREFKRKQLKIQSFSVNLWFEHFGIVVFLFLCFLLVFKFDIVYLLLGIGPIVGWLQRDRAAWLMRPSDPFVDAVADNLLDRLEVVTSYLLVYCCF